MTSRVAIATTPPLLTTALRSLLGAASETVLVLTDTDERFDVAVVTPDGPRVDADIIVVIDATDGTFGGGEVHAEGQAPMPLEGVDHLERLVRGEAPTV